MSGISTIAPVRAGASFNQHNSYEELKLVRQPESIDEEYERNGTANIFILTEPFSGWRKTFVTEHRIAIDWAKQIQPLLDARW